MLILRNLLSLEQEEEVLLHKLVVKLATVSIIEIRLRDVYNVAWGSSISISRSARGSVVSRGTHLRGVQNVEVIL